MKTSQEKLVAALSVMVLDPKILAFLEANDPKALEQARKALAAAKPKVRGQWLCTNDRYCSDPTYFDTVEDFEAMVLGCFPDECERRDGAYSDFELREGTDRDGQEVVYDEHDEVALRWVERDVLAR